MLRWMETTAQVGWFINDLRAVGVELPDVWVGGEDRGVAPVCTA
jgi:hypothetical protein